MKIVLKRLNNNYHFKATDEMGHELEMDAGKHFGGDDLGYRPMQLLIAGLGGCAAVDIVNILKKQKQEIVDFDMAIEAERVAGTEPSPWQQAHILFKLSGKIDEQKLKKAIELSIEKYCSVAYTLRAAGASISYSYQIVEK